MAVKNRITLRQIPSLARAIIREVAAAHGMNAIQIITPDRTKKVFRARVEVALRLNAIGYSTTQIGRMLNHDHTTIVFYLGRGKKKPTIPVWHAPLVREIVIAKKAEPRRPAPPAPVRYLIPYAGADMNDYQFIPRPQREEKRT